MDIEPIVFQAAFEKWFKQCDAMVQDDGRKELGYYLEYKFGRRYISIIKHISPLSADQKSQWAFVDMTNGNILKAAGWGKPETKHARGNIFDEDGGMKYIKWTGPMYMSNITSMIPSVGISKRKLEDWENPNNYSE